MLSWRLWQTISQPLYKNPIFNRVRNDPDKLMRPRERLTVPRYVKLILFALLFLAIMRDPTLIVIAFQIPAIMIVGLVISPLMLPIAVFFAGAYLVVKISSDIHKEKQQYTYELLCASPAGSLTANWQYACGIVHRHGRFVWLRTAMSLTVRVAFGIIMILTVLAVGIMMIGNSQDDGFESIRVILNLSLFAGLFYMTMVQSLVLSLVIGLHSSSLELDRRDVGLIAIVTYIVVQILPYLIVFAMWVILTQWVIIPDSILTLIVDASLLGSIYFLREIVIYVAWHRLINRLNASSEYLTTFPQIVSAHR